MWHSGVGTRSGGIPDGVAESRSGWLIDQGRSGRARDDSLTALQEPSLRRMGREPAAMSEDGGIHPFGRSLGSTMVSSSSGAIS